ncbi:RCC1 and BTB domain-containing protein 1-like isoform X3 [Planococcus citri]|uniref:RCC1 and BTB domain-containing protein 1-like isoform X3 n=1 Tax=Planococcus citri TaxID=170843 RepID=UPI0031FA2131
MDLIHIPYFTSLSKEFIKAIDRVWVSDKRVLIITKKDEVYGMGEGLMADSSQKCDNIHEPKAISCLNGKKVEDFIFGKEFVIALNEDGRLFSWGANNSGQLGLGDVGTTYKPTLISTLSSRTIIKVVCGDNTVFVLTDKGEIFSWGLGDRSPVKSSKLNDRVTDIDIVKSNVSLFSMYSYFCVEDGKVMFQLKSISQGTVLFDNVKNIVCGSSHLLALKHDGSLYSTGYNEKGQLGIGKINDKCTNECVRVLNISEKIIEIASVLDTCAAKTESNRIYVWGACKGHTVPSPFLTSYSSFNEAFLNCTYPVMTYGGLELSSIMKSAKNTQNDHLEIIKLIVNFDERSKSSDFIVVVEEKEIFVHKEILRQRSEYFKTMLNESWSENNKNVLRVNDFTYEAFKIYLQYLYGMDINVTPENVMDLLMIAHRYMDVKLKNLIMENIEGAEVMETSVDLANKILELSPQAFKITSGLFKYMTYPSQ